MFVAFARGRLWEGTSGVDRSQAALKSGALTPLRRLVRPVAGRHREALSDLG